MLSDVSLHIRETSVIVTNSWLEDQFQDLMQKNCLAYLAREESPKHGFEVQFASDFYAAILMLGLQRDMVKVCSVSNKDPIPL